MLLDAIPQERGQSLCFLDVCYVIKHICIVVRSYKQQAVVVCLTLLQFSMTGTLRVINI